MAKTAWVADVVIDARSAGREAIYTYRAEPSLSLGDAVFVPLGPRSTLGFVADLYEAAEDRLGFPIAGLKGVLGRVEGLGLPRPTLDLVRFVATETLCPLPVALSAAAPPGVRDRLTKGWRLLRADARGESPVQDEVLRSLREGGGTFRPPKRKPLPAGILKALKQLQEAGIAEQTLLLPPSPSKGTEERLFRLTSDEGQIERFLAGESKRKPAQALTIMRLQAAEDARLTAGEIKALSGVTDTTVRALIEAGLLEQVEHDPKPGYKPPTPNRHQQLAIDAVVESIANREPRGFLLFGVTGSGKTEVYLRAAAEALRAGRQVLYLVPEIALATQAISSLRERFGRRVAVLHSELPPVERLHNYLRVHSGDAPVVLGARSALFAPLANLGLIVLDEEHESSYKQESAPRYHARRLAEFLAKRHGCPYVLGSATPSIESFYEAEHERLTLLSLPERAADARLPEVHVRDLTEGYRAGHPAILTDELSERLQTTLDRDEQAIFFLNRRAYAPFLICRDCGYRALCPRCAVSLSYHRRIMRLRCHHCGHSAPIPTKCPQCGGHKISPLGIGTEKVEEAVRLAFPKARVARLDRDVARRRGALEEILAGFRSGSLDVLVGTQMVAKGLDFPKVTLVGVIAADVSLNLPDFRASERTFQLLSQVAGRAGRGKAPGLVLFQTFNPDHVAIDAARRHDFLGFYEAVRAEREEAGYPPYRRLVNVILSGPSREDVGRASQEAAALLSALEGVEVLGPVECALERLQNRWRRHVLLKLPPSASVEPVGAALADFAPKGVHVLIDVDPQSML